METDIPPDTRHSPKSTVQYLQWRLSDETPSVAYRMIWRQMKTTIMENRLAEKPTFLKEGSEEPKGLGFSKMNSITIKRNSSFLGLDLSLPPSTVKKIDI